MDLYDGESECEINNTSSSRDFAALAARFTSLQPYLVILNQAHQQQHSCSISFSNPRAVRQLFYAICQVEFSLKMNVPLKSMIPGIDNRLAYLEWIQKELNININNNADSAAANKRIRALDIGTGASCIYPLLAVKHLFPLVEWTATDISKESVEYARLNVERNGFSSNITCLVNPNPNSILYPLTMDGDGDNPQDRHIHDYYAFTMCNPPFYSSVEEMSDRSMQKSSFNINSAKLLPTSASHNELVTDGGEVGFIGKMIKESRMQVIGGKVGWFTTLVGIKSNYEELRRRLNSDTEIKQVKAGSLKAGQTTRWILAWTFNPL